MKFYAKTHGSTLALCDAELLGLMIEEGERVLNITRQFYEGREVEETEALALIRGHDNGVVSGNNAVELALKNNLLREYDEIKNIKYAVYTRID